MDIAVFHPGTQHSWQTATALQDLDRLAWYATSIFRRPDAFPFWLERVVPGRLGGKLASEFSRFEHPALDPARVRTAGLSEWLERIAARMGLRRTAAAIDSMGNRAFARSLQGALRHEKPVALWGYNGSSADVFAAAAERGLPRILDRTIGDWRAYNAVLERIRETHADWFVPGMGPTGAAQIARDDVEYALADRIVCGSAFCARTVADNSPVPGIADKVSVLPYCYDETLFAAPPAIAVPPPGQPIRLLFLGLIAPRKGVQHVLEALSRIPRGVATLTLVGKMDIPERIYARYADRVEWIETVPRSGIPAIMAEHDALLFPSYFEGSALSLLEALAMGLAIIQTEEAGNGASDRSGIVLARPDTDLVQQAILMLAEDRDRLAAMRHAARAEASRYSFAAYRANIAALLAEMGI